MQKLLNSHNSLSPTKAKNEKAIKPTAQETWDEYSSVHDAFTEILSYENSRKKYEDIWQLNYI